MSIVIEHLSKTYRKGTKALDDINLTIDHGIFGLLGQNGAGKSTLMRILTMLLTPTKGNVFICNKQANKKNEMAIKSMIGYMPQEFGFYNNLTVVDCLEYMAILTGIPKSKRKQAISDVIQNVNLEEQRRKKYKELSGGMKRRLGIAQALLGTPKVLIVDEPTVGVDPEERIRIRNILSEYATENVVLLSTHIIEDVEMTCQDLAVIHQGKLLYDGKVEKMLGMCKGKVYKCILDKPTMLKELEKKYTIVSSRSAGTHMELKIISDTPPLELKAEPIAVSLEDAYITMTKSLSA
jgi:ABC-type multidrug transport system ATPase subunit